MIKIAYDTIWKTRAKFNVTLTLQKLTQAFQTHCAGLLHNCPSLLIAREKLACLNNLLLLILAQHAEGPRFVPWSLQVHFFLHLSSFLLCGIFFSHFPHRPPFRVRVHYHNILYLFYNNITTILWSSTNCILANFQISERGTNEQKCLKKRDVVIFLYITTYRFLQLKRDTC